MQQLGRILTRSGPMELAAAALFLSAVDWYGNRVALREVAAKLHDGDWLAELVRTTGFDCSRF